MSRPFVPNIVTVREHTINCKVAVLVSSCEFADHVYSRKMARKFLTVVEVLSYMNSLSYEDFDYPKMTVIPTEPDAVSDEEEIDDYFPNFVPRETNGC
ncbi:hypothetical protein HNY73_002467 [Argiope bruennichi]|uniref:Uncharacterized protein n=1 Tax=Argiope bruennichi TaxID=94029 RepID=A0A8T0FTS1_ARGBR|nr:hypothetical protein HNY73_002467 [Argiope bruennichi]